MDNEAKAQALALQNLKSFREAWDADEVIDEDSGLTAIDIDQAIRATSAIVHRTLKGGAVASALTRNTISDGKSGADIVLD